MKIYSRFTDYYDHPPYLADDTVSYTRIPSEFQKHHLRTSNMFGICKGFHIPDAVVNTLMYRPSYYNGEKILGITVHVLYVAGRRFLGIEIRKDNWERVWMWNPQHIAEAITQIHPEYKDVFLNWYSENQTTTLDYELHIETNSPIILYALLGDPVLHLNTSLKSIKFSEIDAYHLHLAIESTVRDYLTTPFQSTPLTDIQKIINHGMDVKKSFRRSKKPC